RLGGASKPLSFFPGGHQCSRLKGPSIRRQNIDAGGGGETPPTRAKATAQTRWGGSTPTLQGPGDRAVIKASRCTSSTPPPAPPDRLRRPERRPSPARQPQHLRPAPSCIRKIAPDVCSTENEPAPRPVHIGRQRARP